jgi:hypothetical protein
MGSGIEHFSDCATDSDGNTFVCGHYYGGTAIFGSTILPTPDTVAEGTYSVAFVAKMDTGGNWLWAARIGALDNYSYCESVAVGPLDNAYVTGRFRGSTTLGTTTLTSAGGDDMFLAKISSSGSWLWALRAGTTLPDGGMSVALDAAANVYVTGQYNGGFRAFIAIYTTNGNPVVGTYFEASFCYGSDIALDPSGNIYVSVQFSGTITYGPYSLTSEGDEAIMIAKFTSDGNLAWAQATGGMDYAQVWKIAVEGTNSVFFCGRFMGNCTIAGTPLSTTGTTDYDAFVGRIGANGVWLGAVQGGGPGYDIANDVIGEFHSHLCHWIGREWSRVWNLHTGRLWNI